MMIQEQICKQQQKRGRSATSHQKLVEFLFAAGYCLAFCGAVAAKASTTTAGSFPARLPSSINNGESSQQQQTSTTQTMDSHSNDSSNETPAGHPANFWSDAASGGGGESDDGGGSEDEEASSSDFEDSRSNVWMSLAQKEHDDLHAEVSTDTLQSTALVDDGASATLEHGIAASPKIHMNDLASEVSEKMIVQGDTVLDENKEIDEISEFGKSSGILEESVSQPEEDTISSSSRSARLPPSSSRSPPRRPPQYKRATRIPAKAAAPIGSQPLQTLEKLQQMLDETDYMTTANHGRQTATRYEQSSSSSASTLSTEPRRSPPDDSAHVSQQTEKLWTSKDRSKYKKQQQRLRRAEQQTLDARSASKPVVDGTLYGDRRDRSFATMFSKGLQQQALYSAEPFDEEEDYSDDTTDDGLGYLLPDFPVYNSDAEDEGETSGADEESSTTFGTSALGREQAQQKPTVQQQKLFQQPQQQEQQYSTPQANAPLSLPGAIPGMSAPGVVAGTGIVGPSYSTRPPNYYPYYGPQQALPLEQQYFAHQRQHHYSQYAPPGPYSPPRQQAPPLEHPQQQQQYLPYNAYPPLPIPPNAQQNGYPASYGYPPPYYATAQQQQQAYSDQYAAWVAATGYAQLNQAGADTGYTQSPQRQPEVNAGYPSTFSQPHPPLLPSPSNVPTTESAVVAPVNGDVKPPLMADKSRIAIVTASKAKVILASKSRQPFPSPGQVAGSAVSFLPGATPFPIVSTHPDAWLTHSLHEASSDERVDRVPAQSLVEASSRLTFESIQLISLLLLTVGLLSYSAVSPRTLPLTEYNLQFYENLRVACLSTVAPAIYLLSVLDARENDINSVTKSFFYSFTLGYAGTFIVEILATTLLRLAVFFWFEPNVFSLTPRVPIPILPWVLREKQYRPKRITLFAADFGTSCVACPIIEECIKLLLLQWTTSLPRNFNWVTKSSTKRKTKRRVAEAVARQPGEQDCVSANQYVTHMLAVSLGLKLSDAGRRILLYTKAQHANKSFYAICRGIFPIHELCGAMTALALAKRDLLGVNMPMWKLMAPAVVVHGMANFRGMKPIFKWNSATPWSEMQLSPLNVPDASTFLQLAKKGYAKLMWAIVLSRVFGYCVKNYYMVNRQAVKRTTKYAGNHAAFSAELATAEMLKNQKK